MNKKILNNQQSRNFGVIMNAEQRVGVVFLKLHWVGELHYDGGLFVFPIARLQKVAKLFAAPTHANHPGKFLGLFVPVLSSAELNQFPAVVASEFGCKQCSLSWELTYLMPMLPVLRDSADLLHRYRANKFKTTASPI